MVTPSYGMFRVSNGGRKNCGNVNEWFSMEGRENSYEEDVGSYWYVQDSDDEKTSSDIQKTSGVVVIGVGSSKDGKTSGGSGSSGSSTLISKDQKASGTVSGVSISNQNQKDQKTSGSVSGTATLNLKDQKTSALQKDQKTSGSASGVSTSNQNLQKASDASSLASGTAKLVLKDQKTSGSASGVATSLQKTSDQIQNLQKTSGIIFASQNQETSNQMASLFTGASGTASGIATSNQSLQKASGSASGIATSNQNTQKTSGKNLDYRNQIPTTSLATGASGIASGIVQKDQKTSGSLTSSGTSSGAATSFQKTSDIVQNLQKTSNVNSVIDQSIKDQKVKIGKVQADAANLLNQKNQMTSNQNFQMTSGAKEMASGQMTSSLQNQKTSDDESNQKLMIGKIEASGVLHGAFATADHQNQKTSVIQADTSSELCSKQTTGNCGEGWRSFQRPSGEWCMKIFYENSIIQSVAEQRCHAQGAVLSGLQNQLESQFVFSTVTSHIYPGTGSIWVGLKRRKDCLTVGQNAKCNEFNSFEWTDNSTTGTDGMGWACNQPDNSRGKSQHCAVLTASYQGTVLGFQTGLLDDVGCDFDFIKMDKKPRDIKAYICGKKPKI